MQFFYLKNSEGQYLSVMSSGEHRGELCISLDNVRGQESCRVIGIVLRNNNSKLLFLHAESENITLKLRDRPFASVILPFGMESGKRLHTISLYDLQDHSWVCAPPVGQQAGDGRVSDGSNLCKFVDASCDWEAFHLEDISDNNVSLFIKNFLVTFSNFYTDKPTFEIVQKILVSNINNNLKQVVLNALYPSMGVKLLDRISHELKSSSNFQRLFTEVFKDDFWVKNALSPLMAWEKERQNRSFLLCDQQYDMLQQYYKEHDFASITHAINCVYRRSVEPTKKICIVTTIRNEGIYLLEWIAWYKKLGVEHFFIFSNNNDDGSDDLLKALANAGIITWISNEMGANVKPQAKICNYAFSTLPEILDYEWSLVVDVDEFLSINTTLFTDIYGLLGWIERKEVDAVGLNWQYTTSNQTSSDVAQCIKSLVIERVQYFIKDSVIGLVNNIIKSMCKPRYMISCSAHYPVWSEKYHATYRLIQGDIHRYSHNNSHYYSDNPMWADHNHRGIANIVHCRFKTPLEFLLKLYRGDVLTDFHEHSNKSVSLEILDEGQIYHFNQQHMQFGDEIPSHYLVSKANVLSIIDQMRALPGVDDAYNNILAITEFRIKEILHFMRENKERLGSNSLKLLHSIDGE